ncbi:MAG: HEAT repeat domain-containing protein [Myxococcota bacterium]
MSFELSEREREDILRDLQSPDDEVRRLAVERVGALPSEEALPRLVECLGDLDWRVRKSAVERLVAAPDSGMVLDALIEALADGENPGRRNSAVEALVDIGEPAVVALVDTLDSPDVDVRKFAVDALAGVGSRSALEALLGTLSDPDPNVRAAAADALGMIGGDESARSLKALAVDGEQDHLVRFSALGALARLDVAVTAAELAPALDQSGLRAAAFGVLGRMDDPEAVERLRKGVVCGSRSTREAAMQAMLRILSVVDGERGEQILAELRESARSEPSLVPDLVERLESADLSVRLVHVQFMGLLECQACAVPILRAGRDEAVREVAHQTLWALGELAEAALDEEWGGLDVELRCDACAVLGQLSGERGHRRLLAALEEEDAELRGTAARALGRRGRKEAVLPLVHRLEQAARSDDFEAEDEVEAVIDGLVRLAGDPENETAADVLEHITELLSDRYDDAGEPERHAIASVMGQIGRPADAELVSMLLKDPSARVRRAAVDALSRLDAGVNSEPLRLALADESPSVRVAAAAALGGSRSESALDDLRRLLHDEDERVRAAAVRAMGVVAERAGGEAAAAVVEQVGLVLSDCGAVAMAGAEALHRIGGESAARVVAGLLTRNEPELVQAAIACIGEHGDAACVEDLLALVVHDAWAVRAEAIQTLAERRVVKALPSILRRLEAEQDDFVRDVILRALRRLEELQ